MLDLNDASFPHGTTYGYRKSCRCNPCKEAKREDWRRYKEQRQQQQQAQGDPFDDFEGQQEPDQIGEMIKSLILRVKCDTCPDWHLSGQDCPQETL